MNRFDETAQAEQKEALRALMRMVGANIQSCRENCGYTQSELAERAEISITFLSNLERGKKLMSIPVLLKLASALGVSTDQLLYENDAPQKDPLCNIIALLRDKPDSFIAYAEKLLCLSAEEFSSRVK